jgi:hypothetical protein
VSGSCASCLKYTTIGAGCDVREVSCFTCLGPNEDVYSPTGHNTRNVDHVHHIVAPGLPISRGWSLRPCLYSKAGISDQAKPTRRSTFAMPFQYATRSSVPRKVVAWQYVFLEMDSQNMMRFQVQGSAALARTTGRSLHLLNYSGANKNSIN